MRYCSLVTFFILNLYNVYSQVFPNPVTLSTGQGAQGTNDPIWQVSEWFYSLPQSPLTLNYVPAYISNNCAPGAWVDPASLPPPVNNGNWISGSDMVCTGVVGYRYFRLTLNLPPDCGNFSVTTPGAYTLYMDGYVDNVLVDVMINGVSENLPNLPGGNFMAGGQVSLVIDGPWVPGINYVDFLVYNGGGPYGLLMVANTTNSSNSDMDGDGVADINDLCPCDFGTNPVGCVDPPNLQNCNIAQIRSAFAAAGCIELPQCMSSCSMYFLNPQSMTGSQAQAFAQTLGANLISIQSLAENQCIMSELNRLNQTGVIWIGFNDENVEGVFEWYDQSPVTFTNWAPGEPNNAGGNEDCVQIYPNGFWNDLPCTIGNSKSIIEVNLCPVIDAGPNQADCAGTTFNLAASNTLFGSAPYNYQWSNGANTQNTTVTPTSTTTYGVISIDRYGCIAADSLTITVYDNPVSQFTFNNVCFSETAQFTDNSIANSAGGITNWQWNFGDGNNSTQQNTSNNYINDGTYNVTLTVTNANNCSHSSTQAISIYPKPDANFTFTNQCDGNAIPFISTSTINNPASIISLQWDFGDNTNGSGTSINHLYSGAGSYNVTLIVTSNNSCSDTISQQVSVFNNPTASFTFADVCIGNAVNFNNTSSVNNPDVINTYQWVFGDGSPIETTQNPNHTYNNPGAYNVTLIVGTSNGCSDAQTHTVNVYDPPAASFIANNACENTPININNTTSNPVYGAVGPFSWNFGDGSPLNSVDNNPTHTYTTAGTYTITLITSSANLGCADTAQQTITIYPSPTSSFTFTNECFGIANTFTDQSTGIISNYNWSFGDNTSSNQQNPTHTYSGAGSYQVTLNVTSADGCSNTSTQTVIVYPKPNPAFSANNVCLGNITQFTNASTINNPDNITNYIWNFGDGSSLGSGANVNHTYSTAGLFQVTMTAVSNNNCADSVSIPIFVYPNPIVDFVADSLSGCSPHCVNFTNNSTIASGQISNYEWSFGDGAQSFLTSPNHCYINNSLSLSNYSVTLKATSDQGCVTTLSNTNYIISYPLPVADFTSEPNPTTIFKSNVQFFDQSLGATSWLWNFGDNSTNEDSILQNPIHQFVDTGLYTVLLRVENHYGCMDTISKTIDIRPDFAIFIPNAFTPNGDIYNPRFEPKGYGISEFKMYIFDRWGELIYETEDINAGWDGTFNGAYCQQDTYTYRIEVKTFNNKKHKYYGVLNLIR